MATFASKPKVQKHPKTLEERVNKKPAKNPIAFRLPKGWNDK